MNQDQWLHYAHKEVFPFEEIGKNWALKPHKQLNDAFRNASQVDTIFTDIVIKTSSSAIKTICFIEMGFTLLFYAILNIFKLSECQSFDL